MEDKSFTSEFLNSLWEYCALHNMKIRDFHVESMQALMKGMIINMSILRSKIEETIQIIDNNTDLFYQNKIDEGYKHLDNTLIKISDTIEEVIKYQSQCGKDIQGESIVGILTEAMKALENKDALLLADILQYELKEVLEEVKSELL